MPNYSRPDTPSNKNDWSIDSGCSEHMTYDRDLCSSYVAHEQFEDNSAMRCPPKSLENRT